MHPQHQTVKLTWINVWVFEPAFQLLENKLPIGVLLYLFIFCYFIIIIFFIGLKDALSVQFFFSCLTF